MRRLFEKTAARVGVRAWLVGTHTMSDFASLSWALSKLRPYSAFDG